jgi:hypothetical protein
MKRGDLCSATGTQAPPRILPAVGDEEHALRALDALPLHIDIMTIVGRKIMCGARRDHPFFAASCAATGHGRTDVTNASPSLPPRRIHKQADVLRRPEQLIRVQALALVRARRRQLLGYAERPEARLVPYHVRTRLPTAALCPTEANSARLSTFVRACVRVCVSRSLCWRACPNPWPYSRCSGRDTTNCASARARYDDDRRAL